MADDENDVTETPEVTDSESSETETEASTETETETETGAGLTVDDLEEGLKDLEQVAQAADDVVEATSNAVKQPRSVDFIMDVILQVTVEVGQARMTIQDLLQLGQGSVVELEKLAGEPLDIYVNGKQVARGEAVIVNEKFGVRIGEIISTDERVDSLGA